MTSFENRSLVVNATNIQLEKKFICELMSIPKCLAHNEYLHYEVMQRWINYIHKYNMNPRVVGDSLIAFLEKYISLAKHYEPSLKFASISVKKTSDSSNNYYVSSFTPSLLPTFKLDLEDSDSRILLLNSSQIRIESDILKTDEDFFFERFIFTFFLPNGSDPSFLTYELNNSTIENG